MSNQEAVIRDMNHAWHKACKEIIERCVAPDMYPMAMELLYRARAAAEGSRVTRGYNGLVTNHGRYPVTINGVPIAPGETAAALAPQGVTE